MSKGKMRNLVLKNKENVIRVFHCHADDVLLTYNKKTGRLDIGSFQSYNLEKDRDQIKILKKINLNTVKGGMISFLKNYSLEIVNEIENNAFTHYSVSRTEVNRFWIASSVGVCLFLFFISNFVWFYDEEPALKEVMKLQSVKVIKPVTIVKPKKVVTNSQKKKVQLASNNSVEQKKPVKKSLKKLGALAALGQLSQAKQKAGLDLTASQVSQGPGVRALSTSSGSGGVQTAIYSEGMLTSALGSGGNIKGGGGYGTKGTSAGGGTKGYGQITLVGSGGTEDLSEALPLDLNGGGFDTSLIAREIVKYVGKIRDCYDEALKHEPELKGVFVSHFLIGQKGQVVSAKIHKTSQVKSQGLSQCVLSVISQIKFDIQVPQGAMSIVYPFDLSALGT